MNLFFYWLLMLASISLASSVKAQVTLSGQAIDAITQEPLVGASVFIKQTGMGDATDIDGKFALHLEPGDYTVRCRYLGYIEDTISISTSRNSHIKFQLLPESKNLSEIVIAGEKPNANISAPQMSMQKIEMKQVRNMPAFMGEVDVIKAIQLLPGVQSASEGSSGFSVRGGDIDQNLITLDYVPVYNAAHLLGFFSVFNNDYVKNATLYKGDLPSSYGGRLASLLEIESIVGNSDKIHGKGGIGTISSRLTLEGPLADDWNFVLSARRSYVDLFLLFAKDEAVRESSLWFYDLNGKVSWSPDHNNHLILSGYSGDDKMGNKYFSSLNGNKNVSLKWTHIIEPDFYLNSNVYFSRYRYVIGTDDRAEEGFEWRSEMDDVGTNFIFTRETQSLGNIDFGFNSVYHILKPAIIKPTSSSSIYGETRLQTEKSIESGAFVSIKPEVGDHLKLKAGLRLVNFSNMGSAIVYKYDNNYEVRDSSKYSGGEVIKSTWALEPRLGATWMFNEQTSIKASYCINNQYIQQARNSTMGTPYDIWFTASKNIAPQRCQQVAFGIFQNLYDNKIKLSAEGFYKDMDNAIDFKDHPNLLFNEYLEGEIRQGEALSQGVELMAEFNDNRLSGWISYTYSDTKRKIKGIENYNWYPSSYDKPHDVSVVATYKLTDRIVFGANWNYSTGLPMTKPNKSFPYAGARVPIFGNRSTDRMPDYHRLDLSVTIEDKPRSYKKWKGEWNISIYNAYNRHNAWSINFLEDQEDGKAKAELTYLFPFLPSVTYNFKF